MKRIKIFTPKSVFDVCVPKNFTGVNHFLIRIYARTDLSRIVVCRDRDDYRIMHDMIKLIAFVTVVVLGAHDYHEYFCVVMHLI